MLQSGYASSDKTWNMAEDSRVCADLQDLINFEHKASGFGFLAK